MKQTEEEHQRNHGRYQIMLLMKMRKKVKVHYVGWADNLTSGFHTSARLAEFNSNLEEGDTQIKLVLMLDAMLCRVSCYAEKNAIYSLVSDSNSSIEDCSAFAREDFLIYSHFD